MSVPAHFKKSLTLAFCLAQTFCFADTVNSRLSALESRMSAVKVETAKRTVGAQMASASPLFDGYGLFVTADVLYWHLYEGGTDYALSSKVSGPANFPKTSGKTSRVHFDWDFGFRLGGGYHFEHDAWDAYVNFTWFQTDGSGHAHSEGGSSLALQKGAINGAIGHTIKAHWDVHQYIIDLEVGRRFFVSKFLAFRPQFGLETAWIQQKRRFKMTEPLNVSTNSEGEIVRGTCDFWGIGPRAGIEGAWYWSRHFSLFSAFNAALLWGHFATHDKEKNITPTGTVPSVTARDHFHRMAPHTQLAAGLSWDGNISQDRFHLEIRLSYEFQYWWRQNQFLNEEQPLISGLRHESQDMTINGVTLNLLFDF